MLRVVLLALALTALMSVVFLFTSPRSASAQSTPTADYRFQNTLKTSVGTAPALTKIGPKSNTFTTATVDGTSHRVLRFPQGNGLKLSPTTGVVSSSTYTIVVLFELDRVDGFRRLIDFKNGGTSVENNGDTGLYVHDSKLEFFRPFPPQGPGPVSGTGAPIAANTYVQVVLSRDSGGTVVGYVDGVQQFSFTDSSNDAVIDSSFNTLRFFRDNESDGSTTEHSAGSVARIRLYNSALSNTEVGELDRLEPTTFTVNSTADGTDNLLQDGKCSTGVPQQCSLRAAIMQSNHTLGNDTINFASDLSGTISLTQGQLFISNEPDSLTIEGPKPRPGARILTVSASNASRVFFVADDAKATINRLRIINGNPASNGGGIFNDGDSLTLTNSTVSGNTASGSGGGIHSEGNSLTLIYSTVSGNTSDGSAGILNDGGTMTITNSTVSGNNATFNGGGIFNFGANSTMTLTNSTVTNNTAGGGGGGINNSGTAILRNTIVAGNSATTGPDAFGIFSSQGNNLIGNTSGAAGFGGSDILGRNPLLGPLQDNGGPTDTHALLRGSPALNTIPFATNGCGTDIRSDQRALKRPQGKRCDTGSYEKKVKKRRR